MPRATCRCGQALTIPADPSERVVCPKGGSKVRVRFPAPAVTDMTVLAPDGYLRFFCSCGRKLKVDAENPPSHGKCPDCGQVVPVPMTNLASNRAPGHPESLTEEMSAVDKAMLDRWASDHLARSGKATAATAPPASPSTAGKSPSTDRVEVGLRVCPRCGQPVPLGALACRQCGTPVPKR